MKLLDIYARLKPDMNRIERELARSVECDLPMLNEASLHLLKAGGKRIRPVVVLLAAEFGTYDLQRLKHVAVPLELIHMATLVHDDVIDNADTRRGQLTVKSKWDNRVAMYTGDYIFARALAVAAELGEPRIHRILSKAMVEMSIGEMEQVRLFFDLDQSIRDYLLRIRRKTALLIAISCQLGALAAGADEPAVRALYKYGYNIGMCFQIRDDLLDLTGTEKELGKPPGSDVKQGNITLPVIYALRNPDTGPALRTQLEFILRSQGKDGVEPFLTAIRGSDGLRQASELSDKFLCKALEALEPLPPIKAKQNLIDIAHFVANRSH